jgi:purine-binding chemotaxis protein CheW
MRDVAELRRAFDQSFAEPPATGGVQTEDLLEVRFGGSPYALRLNELAMLISDVRVTPVPSPMPELLGVAGLRGAIVPVYDIGALIGHRTDSAHWWLAIAAGEPAVGFAFSGLERHRRVPVDDVVSEVGPDLAARHVTRLVHVDGDVRPVVSVRSIVESLVERLRGRTEFEKGADPR